MKISRASDRRPAWPEYPMLRSLHARISGRARAVIADLVTTGASGAQLREALSRMPDDLVTIHQFLSSLPATPFRGTLDSVDEIPPVILESLAAEQFGVEQQKALRDAAEAGWPCNAEPDSDEQWQLCL